MKAEETTPFTTSQRQGVSAEAREVMIDCWNKIGVAGDGTCVELPGVIHCRNCPVYSEAGTILLNRAAPADYRRDLTEHFSKEKKRAATGKNSLIIFRIQNEWLALPTEAFQEIVEPRPIHSLPHRRRGLLLGLVNVRGELLICVSLGRLLGIASADANENHQAHRRLVLLNWRGTTFTFPVDQIDGIHRYQAEDLKPIPATAAKPSFATGLLDVNGKMAGCLNAELLFATITRSLQ